MQAWPALVSAPYTQASAALARSASSATIIGSLPPSSSSTGVKRSAAAIITRLPVAAEPVNAILSTADFASAAPVAPAPVTTCNTSGSANVFAAISTSLTATSGVSSLGLNTTAFPAASAYAIE